MDTNNLEFPELPTLPKKEVFREEIKESNEQLDKIKELELIISNLKFFSNSVDFNSTIYQYLVVILDKITNLEEKVNNLPKNG